MPAAGPRVCVRDGFTVIAVYGELDVSTVAETARALSACAASGVRIIVNLAGLTFADCGSLRSVLSVRDQARRAGGDLVLAAPQPLVVRVLRLTGLIDLCPVFATAQEAAHDLTRFRDEAPPVASPAQGARLRRASA